jgi:hypothetical protein
MLRKCVRSSAVSLFNVGLLRVEGVLVRMACVRRRSHIRWNESAMGSRESRRQSPDRQ